MIRGTCTPALPTRGKSSILSQNKSHLDRRAPHPSQVASEPLPGPMGLNFTLNNWKQFFKNPLATNLIKSSIGHSATDEANPREVWGRLRNGNILKSENLCGPKFAQKATIYIILQ